MASTGEIRFVNNRLFIYDGTQFVEYNPHYLDQHIDNIWSKRFQDYNHIMTLENEYEAFAKCLEKFKVMYELVDAEYNNKGEK